MFERYPQALSFLAILASIFALLAPGSAHAQVPGGSYLRTCEGAHMNGDVLEARCQNMNGHWRRAYLPRPFRCPSGVENIDGSLRCVAYREPPRPRLPGGSYMNSCGNIRMDGSTLIASCRTRRGHMVESALPHAFACRGVDNIDGALMCRR
ncbi:MAG: hypothetical protein JWN73_1665 [Betaproteobacteria bacterium]|nr:hypothetical protein [Betaproteobacteria bacterium]